MRHATLRLSSPPVILAVRQLCVVALLCLLAASHASAQGKQQTISGYADFYKNGFLIVEGQRIAASQSTVFKKVAGLAATPLGYEVKVKGVRQPDGTFLAAQLEAKQNGIAMMEPQVLAQSDAEENFCVSNGMLLEQGQGGEMQSMGRIISAGPEVERARNIMARLLPPYVRPDRIRVRLVENEEWQAMAMPNGAVWVFTGLMRDMSDDEIAVVLGHELAHYTYEHSRKKAKQLMWINLAANAAAGATKNNQAAQQLAALGLALWWNGYGRESEDQADRVGLRYTYEAGFDVEKGSRIWLRFLEKYGQKGKLYNIIHYDHSRPSERFASLQSEISMNYLAPPAQPTRPAAELAAAGVIPSTQPAAQPTPAVVTTRPAAANILTRPIGRRPDSLTTLRAQPSAAVAAPRPLPPHVVRSAVGKLLPAGGYQWLNPTDPNDLRVRLMPGLVNTEDGKFCPAGGYQWLNPTDPKDFRVKLMPGLIKSGEDLRPDKGYRWVNPKDLKDLRVEPIP